MRYENIRKNFAENLKRIRKERGYSGRGLSKEIGAVKHTVCLYEKGGALPKIPTLLKLCETLVVTPNDLLGICHPVDLIGGGMRNLRDELED